TDEQTTNVGNWITVGDTDADHMYGATTYNASQSYSLRTISLLLKTTTSPTHNITLNICTIANDNIKPNCSIIYAKSPARNATTMNASFEWYNFTLNQSVAIDVNTNYAFVGSASANAVGSKWEIYITHIVQSYLKLWC
ncbi:unnamed protein product, partial [marine sediment metagenome]